jgi:hypothetical protein
MVEATWTTLTCFDNTMTRETDSTRCARAPTPGPPATSLRYNLPRLPVGVRSSAFTGAGIGKRLGFGDANEKVRGVAAGRSGRAQKNAITFAVLDMKKCPRDGLAKFKAKGYTVLAPTSERRLLWSS